MISIRNMVCDKARGFCTKVQGLLSPKTRKRVDHAKTARNEGYSIVAVTAFSVVAGAWMLMTAGVALPVYQKAAEFRYWSTVRSSAEAGLDYVVSQLDAAFQNSTSSTYDDLTLDGVSKSTVLPSSVTGTQATVTVSVNNMRAPTTSSLYKDYLDDTVLNNSVGSVNRFRVITSSATYAGYTSSVRIVLGPNWDPATAVIGSSTTTSTSTITNPFFNYAMFSHQALAISANMTTDAYDSRLGAYSSSNKNSYKGHIGTNTSVSLGANANIGGNVVVTSLPKGSTTAVVATRSANAVVQNQLKVNGVTSGFTATDGPTPNASDHVKALEFGTPRSGDYTTPMDKSLSADQVTLSVAPSAPSGAYNVGAISISGNGKVIVQNGAAPVSSINVSANNTIYIPPGNYKASSISITSNGQFQLQSSVTTNTVISLEGSTAGANVITMTGNGVANATQVPARFQIVTNSSKATTINANANFHGIIYAPSSNITMSGNSAIFGAIAGKQITSSANSAVHFDLALADATYANNNGLAYTTTSTVTETTPASNIVNGLKVISWEER